MLTKTLQKELFELSGAHASYADLWAVLESFSILFAIACPNQTEQ
jgi:hypothetical protein